MSTVNQTHTGVSQKLEALVPKIQKVTDPSKVVTDSLVLKQLAKQGIDKDYVEFWHDYAPRSRGKEYSPYAKFYRDLKSDKKFMVTSGLPKVKPDGQKIEVGWLYDEGKYHSKPNLFSAIIDDNQIQVTCLSDINGTKEGEQVTWRPQLFIDSVEIFCNPEPELLPVDPINENYYQNVLEWDYEVCLRRLRLIHGGILERWIVPQHPNADIRVKHNKQGELSLSLAGAWDADGTHLPVIYTEDEEIIPRASFDMARFPVTIGASLTAYSTFYDGYGRPETSTVYLTARNGTTFGGDSPWTSQDIMSAYQVKINGNYYVGRLFLFHDTSPLPDGCTITAATLSVYGEDHVNHKEDDPGQADLLPYEGTFSTPLASGDIDNFGVTLLTDDASPWEFKLAIDGYNTISLNAAGLAIINKTGTTKICCRCSGDVNAVAPAGANESRIWASEKGEGFQPRLVVTYEIIERVFEYTEINPTYVEGHGGGRRAFTLTEINPFMFTFPAVTTNPATAIEATTATGNGNITDIGGEDCDKRGFVYDTSPHGDPGDTAPADSEYADYVEETDSFGTGAFTGALTSLDPKTPYYVRAYAHNSAGYAYGDEVSFTTLAAIPTVTTDAASALSAIAATLNGTLADNGGEDCECGFQWGLDTGYGITTPTESKTTSEAFSQIIGGLAPNTTYHFRAFATNSAGTGYGADQSFTTSLLISRAHALSREEL